MSAAETVIIVLILFCAAFYLLRRVHRLLRRSGQGCCGRCPVGARRPAP